MAGSACLIIVEKRFLSHSCTTTTHVPLYRMHIVASRLNLPQTVSSLGLGVVFSSVRDTLTVFRLGPWVTGFRAKVNIRRGILVCPNSLQYSTRLSGT